RTLYRASRVHTLSPYGGGSWLLVDERHVERAGSGEPPQADRVVDLPGTTIIPGFVDAHVHLSATGMKGEGLDLSPAGSKDELLSIVRDYAGDRDGPVFGAGFDEFSWEDPKLPTIAELDGVSLHPIVLVRTDGYLSLANERALELSGALQHEGAERDPAGRPTGLLRKAANSQAQRWYHASLEPAAVQDAQLRAAGLAASRGVTTVQEMAMPDKQGRRDVEVLLGHLQRLPVDCIVYIADMDLPWVMEHGFPRAGGDLTLDGSIGARTAAVLEPYEDGEGSGALQYDDDTLVEFLHNAHLGGLQVGLHVIGDAAIEQALRVWERVYHALDSRGRRHFRARRHRLEHFEMASMQQVERAAGLGLAISIQPVFDAFWGNPGGMYEQRLGSERAWPMNPFRELMMRGLEVGAGSDTPVTPLDPMFGIWALENHHDPAQRMGRDDAIRLFTVGAARIGHLEKKGRLEPGSSADFAAYEVDPFDVPDPRELRPVLTVSRGREVSAR
ncbi:MAG TPA: amidohydrolase family protein, partial [Actinomycetota bacterium]